MTVCVCWQLPLSKSGLRQSMLTPLQGRAEFTVMGLWCYTDLHSACIKNLWEAPFYKFGAMFMTVWHARGLTFTAVSHLWVVRGVLALNCHTVYMLYASSACSLYAELLIESGAICQYLGIHLNYSQSPCFLEIAKKWAYRGGINVLAFLCLGHLVPLG